MRARFNETLDGNLGSLIFHRLGPLDQCMARATCRDWRALVPPLKMEQGSFDCFLRDLAEYDRPEYVAAIQRHLYLHLELDGCKCWSAYENAYIPNYGICRLFEKGAASALLLYWRMAGLSHGYWKTHIWEHSLRHARIRDEILLPIFSMRDSSKFAKYFWHALQSREAIAWTVGVMPLIFTQTARKTLWVHSGLDALDHVSDWEQRRDGLTWLRDECKAPTRFWLELIDQVWCFSMPDSTVDHLIWLIHFAQMVSPLVCNEIAPGYHVRFQEICGCDIIRKRPRK